MDDKNAPRERELEGCLFHYTNIQSGKSTIAWVEKERFTEFLQETTQAGNTFTIFRVWRIRGRSDENKKAALPCDNLRDE